MSDTIEYLKQVKLLAQEVKNGHEELQELELMARKVTVVYGKEKVQGGYQYDRVSEVVAKIVDLQVKIIEDTNKLIELRIKIFTELENVKTSQSRQLLHSRYMLFKTWDEIADNFNCTFQWVHKLHKKAILEFEEANVVI